MQFQTSTTVHLDPFCICSPNHFFLLPIWKLDPPVLQFYDFIHFFNLYSFLCWPNLTGNCINKWWLKIHTMQSSNNIHYVIALNEVRGQHWPKWHFSPDRYHRINLVTNEKTIWTFIQLMAFIYNRFRQTRQFRMKSPFKTRTSMYGCMSTETTSMSLQIINISRFYIFWQNTLF